MIIGHAYGSRSATNRRTDGNAAAEAVAVRFANFHFATLGIRLALIFGHRTAAVTVVGVTSESSPANALADMVSSSAVGIGGASVTHADGSTFSHSQNVLTTNGIGFTVRVCDAIRKSWFFARPGGGVAYEIR